MFMLKWCNIWVVIVLLSSCSTGVYSHYPKAKRGAITRKIATSAFKKQTLTTHSLGYSSQLKQTESFSPHLNRHIAHPIVSKPTQTAKRQNAPLGDKPRDATPTNKKAKKAFWSAAIALGSLAAGISLSPWFLLIMIPFAVLALINALKARKQIKQTGEYGWNKTVFALFVSIPILVLTIVGVLAYLLSNGTGVQVGNFLII